MEIKSFRQFSSIINESCHSEKEVLDEIQSGQAKKIYQYITDVLDVLDSVEKLSTKDVAVIDRLVTSITDKLDSMQDAGIICEDWFTTKDGLHGFGDGKGGYHYGADNIAKYAKTVKASKSTTHKAKHDTKNKYIHVEDEEGNTKKYRQSRKENSADFKARIAAEHKAETGKDLEF